MLRCFLVVALALTACQKKTPVPASFTVRELGLTLPALPGWRRDTSVELDGVRKRLLHELDAGGVVFRLVREDAVAGSPRIDVVVEPKPKLPTELDAFLQRNLQDMADLERQGSIRISSVAERAVTLGPRRAYRVRHEYTMPGQAALTQVSTLVVLDGRGVAITAAGRAELFQPLSDAIDQIMRGLSTATPTYERRRDEPSSGATKPLDLAREK